MGLQPGCSRRSWVSPAAWGSYSVVGPPWVGSRRCHWRRSARRPTPDSSRVGQRSNFRVSGVRQARRRPARRAGRQQPVYAQLWHRTHSPVSTWPLRCASQCPINPLRLLTTSSKWISLSAGTSDRAIPPVAASGTSPTSTPRGDCRSRLARTLPDARPRTRQVCRRATHLQITCVLTSTGTGEHHVTCPRKETPCSDRSAS